MHVHESLGHYTQEFLTILRRRNYITPKHYLDYVTTYIRLLDEKTSFITKQIARYSEGIKKIDDASAQIDLLRAEVEKTKKEATKAARECDIVMADIENCKLTALNENSLNDCVIFLFPYIQQRKKSSKRSGKRQRSRLKSSKIENKLLWSRKKPKRHCDKHCRILKMLEQRWIRFRRKKLQKFAHSQTLLNRCKLFANALPY